MHGITRWEAQDINLKHFQEHSRLKVSAVLINVTCVRLRCSDSIFGSTEWLKYNNLDNPLNLLSANKEDNNS